MNNLYQEGFIEKLVIMIFGINGQLNRHIVSEINSYSYPFKTTFKNLIKDSEQDSQTGKEIFELNEIPHISLT